MAIIGRTTTDGPETRALGGALTGEDYMSLVASKDVSARAAAAARDDAPLGALLAFAQDKNADVARALVANSAVHLAAIARIADVGPRAVRALAQGRLLA